jgi:hypothetical protein
MARSEKPVKHMGSAAVTRGIRRKIRPALPYPFETYEVDGEVDYTTLPSQVRLF